MNPGSTPQGNQVPPQVQACANDQASVDPTSMKDGGVMAALFQMAQVITTKAPTITI